MSKFTNEEKATEAEREVKMRKKVYARWRPMDKEDERKVAIMQEIADEYREREQRTEKLI